MSLLGLEAKKELPVSFWQILALHADVREATSVDRLHQGDPLKLFVDRQGILSVLGRCLITGDKPQAAQERANSMVPQAVITGHHLHPFLLLHITYHPTHNTHFPNSPPFNLLMGLFQTIQSETTSHLFSLYQVPDTVEEHMGLDKGIPQVDMEEVKAQCSLVLHLKFLKIVIIFTNGLAMDPIQWYLQVVLSHHLQTVWIIDTPTASSMKNLLLSTLSLMPTRPFLL